MSDPTATGSTLRDDAVAIWMAGVRAVDSSVLVHRAVERRGDTLLVAGESISLAGLDRLLVLGGGKAGAGMAAGLEDALGSDLVDARVQGWLNVPADCVRSLRRIHLHAGRAAGQNEPTAAGVFGAEQILSLAASMGPHDLAVVLLSGGGSALLPAPVPGISLADKQAVTRFLMHRGATIEELNAVRSSLSRFKAGGLLRAMPAGRCVALIISDVVGDPLDVIASGPTVPQPSDPRRALMILKRLAKQTEIPSRVWSVLEATAKQATADTLSTVPVRNVIIGNNQTALDATAAEAVRRGYTIAGVATNQRGIAREVGVSLAEQLLRLQSQPCPSRGWCLLSGGEPTVQLIETNQPRKGGRNQELVLAALVRLRVESLERIALLSGGTDGEDGPTDAAGAVLDVSVQQQADARGLDAEAHLAINNAYPYFVAADGLLKTGPTHTNVMDVRVGLVSAE